MRVSAQLEQLLIKPYHSQRIEAAVVETALSDLRLHVALSHSGWAPRGRNDLVIFFLVDCCRKRDRVLAELVVDGIHGLCHSSPLLSIRILKESHLVVVFAKGRKRDAEKPHACAEAYAIEDSHGRAVDFTGIIRGGGQGGLPRERLEIRVPHGERDLLALVAVASCPPPNPFT